MGITIRADRRGDRRRRGRRPAVQGRAGRRALGRLRARRTGRHARRLRGPGRSRRDHGLRRAGRAGRPRLHGRHRPLLPPLHAGPVVRQVHVLPRRHAADARHPRPDLHRARASTATWKSSEQLAAHGQGGQHLRPGTAPRPTPCSPRSATSATSTRPTWPAAARPASARP